MAYTTRSAPKGNNVTKHSDRFCYNFSPGGEINTIQTGLKTLDSVIRLGAAFSVRRLGAPVVSLDGRMENDTPRRITRLGFPTPSVLCISVFPLSPPCSLIKVTGSGTALIKSGQMMAGHHKTSLLQEPILMGGVFWIC